MKKRDVVRRISKELRVTQDKGEIIYSAIINQLMTQLGKGNKVTLSAFGTFRVVTRRQRPGYNPRTGEKITIPQRLKVNFKASNNLARSLQS